MRNIEFYNTPEGDVMIREGNKLRVLEEKDRDFITEFLQTIMDFYPEAFKALCDE